MRAAVAAFRSERYLTVDGQAQPDPRYARDAISASTGQETAARFSYTEPCHTIARAYRWNLEQFLMFVRKREGRAARVGNLTPETIRPWMDAMAAADLALSIMRARQSTLSSFCAWLVKRDSLGENPVAKLDRPRYERTPPRQVPGAELMDALIEAAKQRKCPRDVALFLILRYSGMRRESVASLRIRHLDGDWGLRGVLVKGGKTRDIHLPAAVMLCLPLIRPMAHAARRRYS